MRQHGGIYTRLVNDAPGTGTSGLQKYGYPGLTTLDAAACGAGAVAVLDEDLGRAARAALDLDPARCRAFAEEHSWARCADLFRSYLALPPAVPDQGSRAVAL